MANPVPKISVEETEKREMPLKLDGAHPLLRMRCGLPLEASVANLAASPPPPPCFRDFADLVTCVTSKRTVSACTEEYTSFLLCLTKKTK